MRKFTMLLGLLLTIIYSVDGSALIDSCDQIQCKGNIGLVIDFHQELAVTPDIFLNEPWCRSESYVVKVGTPLVEIAQITSDLWGETMPYTVTSSSGVSCNGQIKVNVRNCGELFKPEVSSRKFEISCLQDDLNESVGMPIPDSAVMVTENMIGNWSPCENIRFIMTEWRNSFPCNNPYQLLIQRYWTFSNEEVSHRVIDSILILREGLDKVTELHDYDGSDRAIINCDSMQWFENGLPDPAVFGQPFPTDQCDGIAAEKKDLVINVVDHPCFKFQKIIREWTLINWCQQEVLRDTQYLYVQCGDDNQKPVIRCKSPVTVDLNFIQSGILRAEDVDEQSTDDCMIARRFFEGDIDLTHLKFGPGDIGQKSIWFHVLDFAGNEDSCLIEVNIIGYSGNEGNVGGRFLDYQLQPVTEVMEVLYDARYQVSGASSFQQVSLCGIPSSPPDLDYSVCLDNNGFAGPYSLMLDIDHHVDDFLQGVTTKDLVLMFHHLVNKVPESPFHHYAADINGDNMVSVVDAALLRKIILGNHKFEGQVWKFFVPDTQNIQELSTRTFSQLPRFDQDIVPVRVGDLDHPVLTGLGPDVVTRGGELTLEMINQYVDEGQVFQVELMTPQPFEGVGFQLGISYAADGDLELVDVYSEPFGDQGYWSSFSDQWRYVYVDKLLEPFSEQGKLLTLSFRALKSGLLTELLDIQNPPLDLMLINSDFDITELEIVIQSVTSTDDDQKEEGIRAYPNPFSDKIKFDLSGVSLGEGVLEVYDVRGRLVLIKEWDGSSSGIEIHERELPADGMYIGVIGQSSVRFIKR